LEDHVKRVKTPFAAGVRVYPVGAELPDNHPLVKGRADLFEDVPKQTKRSRGKTTAKDGQPADDTGGEQGSDGQDEKPTEGQEQDDGGQEKPANGDGPEQNSEGAGADGEA
jgi:hypothetical protein